MIQTPINVLCYGDSNTYGYKPIEGTRYPSSVRWTGRLQMLLGEEYHVIEEGCNGRTNMYKQPGAEWKNGYDYLKPCLNSHKPVDIVIFMLGTNDLKFMYGNKSAKEIAECAEVLVKDIIDFTKERQDVPEIILISPPEIGEDITKSMFVDSFDETSIARSKEFPKYYKEVADRNGCVFFDAAKHIGPSKEDSLHLTEESHKILAEELAKVVKGL